MPDEGYSTEFFSQQNTASTNSARVVVPLVTDRIHPQRIVDLGCGIGAWLKVFKEHGCTQVRGYDGDYVDRALLTIDPSEFFVADLGKPLEDEFAPYDLAVSLETAEHIAPESADIFVESLTRLAPVVLFSAAIPGQGGTLHVNEQWPSYWAKKFLKRGYVPIDFIRPRIWDCEQVESYYIQNVILYARPEAIALYPLLAEEQAKLSLPLDLVHPRQFDFYMAILNAVADFENVPIGDATRRFGRSVKGFLMRRMGRETRKS